MFDFLKRRRRARIADQPFPPEWEAVLRKNVPAYATLSGDEREELRGLVRIFVAEKSFEGCGGVRVTDEMRVTIAGQACLLILHVDDDVYPRLRSILIYPQGYRAPVEARDGDIVHEGHSDRLGESWGDGAVVLSWDGVRAGQANPGDGRNLVIHEFAHQLDQEDGAADGTPVLGWASYLPWARVLSADFLELRDDAARGRRTVLDRYGAVNEAEFFAVAAEAFFEKPRALLRRHPELYDELRRYFRQDPAAVLRGQAGADGEGKGAAGE